jgi:hypothetical protein
MILARILIETMAQYVRKVVGIIKFIKKYFIDVFTSVDPEPDEYTPLEHINLRLI